MYAADFANPKLIPVGLNLSHRFGPTLVLGLQHD
jgi:hypothetical protein